MPRSLGRPPSAASLCGRPRPYPARVFEHRRRRRTRRKPTAVPRRRASYYLVAGIDLRVEMERLRSLPVFADGELAGRAPQLKVRRATAHPNRLGFAIPGEWRLSVTAYPGIRPGDALETLLHELVHLHVGRHPGARAWHGRAFKQTLTRAMAQAYGISGVQPRNALHGAYAEAIERRRAAAGAQLRLALTA